MIEQIKSKLAELNTQTFTPNKPTKFEEDGVKKWFEGITTYKHHQFVIVSTEGDKCRIPLDNIKEPLAKVILYHLNTKLLIKGKPVKV